MGNDYGYNVHIGKWKVIPPLGWNLCSLVHDYISFASTSMLCAFRVKKPFAFSAKWLSQKNVKRLERIDVRGRILITCLYLPFVKSFLM